MATINRRAHAQWKGTGKEGQGTLSGPSGVLKDTPYSFKTRFESEDGRAGTNPEELLGAAHAGCFTMALAFQLQGAGHTPEALDTHATVELSPQATGGFAITAIHLELKARVPGCPESELEALAQKAKEGCPVSRALKAVPITLRVLGA